MDTDDFLDEADTDPYVLVDAQDRDDLTGFEARTRNLGYDGVDPGDRRPPDWLEVLELEDQEELEEESP